MSTTLLSLGCRNAHGILLLYAVYQHLSNLPPKKGWVTYEAMPTIAAYNHTELRPDGRWCVRECCLMELLTRELDTLPQSPGLGPHIMRTPTPPWANGMEVAGLENAGVNVVPEMSAPSGEAPSVPRKAKRIRVQLDRRIELTDDELKVIQCFCLAQSIL